ncbi:MAG TPA: hypothetical protein VFX20_18115 [Steroidobacteraceae bacterium]|nr:hypothetical protein [Steroidobacteraceae bacterium]
MASRNANQGDPNDPPTTDPTAPAATTAPPAKAPTAAPPKPRKVPELHQDRLREADHAYRRWMVTIPHGTLPSDLEAAAYWAHLSHMLRAPDELFCRWEDNTGEATARVIGSGHGWVKVEVLHSHKYQHFSPEALNVILPGHKVKYVNNFAKWVVLREADQRVLKDQCDSEGEAYTWLANYAKSVAA